MFDGFEFERMKGVIAGDGIPQRAIVEEDWGIEVPITVVISTEEQHNVTKEELWQQVLRATVVIFDMTFNSAGTYTARGLGKRC